MKWPLIGLAVVLLVASLGVIELQKRRMEQKSADLRECFLRHAPIGVNGRIAQVSSDFSHPYAMGLWQGPELDEVLSDVHLQPSHGDEAPSPDFQITTGIDATGHPEGIFLSVSTDEGYFFFNSPQYQDELQGLVLSPASCRALKSRIWSHYGDKLHDLEALTTQ